MQSENVRHNNNRARQDGGAGRVLRIVAVVILSLIAFAGGVVAVMNALGKSAPLDLIRRSFSGSDVTTDQGAPILSIPYDLNDGVAFCLYEDYIVTCTRTFFSLVNADGTEEQKINIDFKAPSLFRSGTRLLAFDTGGRAAFAMRGDEVVWNDRFDGAIISGTINEAGYMAFVLETREYRNSVRVISPTGKKLFDWVVADDFVISADVTEDGSYVLVNRLSASGVAVNSRVEILDMRATPVATVQSVEGDAFVRAIAMSNRFVAAASSNATFGLYSDELSRVSETVFDEIYALCEFPKKHAAVAAMSNGALTVASVDAEGRAKELLTPVEPVVNMTAENGRLMINMGNLVTIINEDGDTVFDLEADEQILYCSMIDGKRVLAVTAERADIYAIV